MGNGKEKLINSWKCEEIFFKAVIHIRSLSFSSLHIFYTPNFLRYASSTLPHILYIPHFSHSEFQHSAVSTLFIFHTPHFLHYAFSTPRPPRIPPNGAFVIFGSFVNHIQFIVYAYVNKVSKSLTAAVVSSVELIACHAFVCFFLSRVNHVQLGLCIQK